MGNFKSLVLDPREKATGTSLNIRLRPTASLNVVKTQMFHKILRPKI